MEHEPAPRLDGSAVMDGDVRRLSRIDLELAQQCAKADARALVADADADRAVFVVDAHGDDRTLEPRVGHSGHRQQQFAGQEGRFINHLPTMSRRGATGKP
jgi:hypothetical protein